MSHPGQATLDRLKTAADVPYREPETSAAPGTGPQSAPPLTPKQEYEARKAERAKLKDMDHQIHQRTEQVMMLDMIDRFVTAAERIADALERRPL